MAELNTKYFGKLSYTDEELIHFEEGLFGFEAQHDFILICFEENSDSMLCLQSVSEESLAFIVINPFHFLPQYAPQLTESDLNSLKVDDENKLLFYVICVVQEPIQNSTANLKCPIVIHSETKKAKQVILDDTLYSFKHSFSEFIKTEEA